MGGEVKPKMEEQKKSESGESGIDRVAFRLFGNFFMRRRARYAALREALLKARLYLPVEKWLSRALLYSIFAAAGAVAAYVAFKSILAMILGESLSLSLLDILSMLGIITISFIGTYFGYCYYPRVIAWERRGRIDQTLPYAISYISAMASIGVIPYMIFKKLSEAEETYGEVSREVRHMIRDVDLLGLDFMTALKKLIALTPSTNMRAFLQGAITTALSGGEMGDYFINSAREYMDERRAKYESFIETLALFAEFYVIGIVVAPLLLVVVLTIMCFLGNASLDALAAIVYLAIPLGSFGFIILIELVKSE